MKKDVLTLMFLCVGEGFNRRPSYATLCTRVTHVPLLFIEKHKGVEGGT
jgi:hypothetical protein